MIKKDITMLGKHIEVNLSRSAVKNLENHTEILYLEMELYFSCMM